MCKYLLYLSTFLLVCSPICARDYYASPHPNRIQRRGRAAMESSENVIAYSMIFWGVGIGVVAAVVAGMVQGSKN